jgi:hypothetical protein
VLIWCPIAGLFRSRAALQVEILVLRHQLNMLRSRSPKRVAVGNREHSVFVGLFRLAPRPLDALEVLQPETFIRWHRTGFRGVLALEITAVGQRSLRRRRILEMGVANPLWGAPRIHGELLKLGIDVGQTTDASLTLLVGEELAQVTDRHLSYQPSYRSRT